VELQDQAPLSLFSRVAYNNAATAILDRKGEAMQILHDLVELENFTVHPTAVEVTGENERNKFRWGINQIFANLTEIDDLDDATNRTDAFFRKGLELLQPGSLDVVTITSLDVAAVESFEELRDRMHEVLVSDFSGLSKAVGYDIGDTAWVLEFGQGDTTGRVQFGPMRSEELPARLKIPRFDDAPPNMLGVFVDLVFRPDEAGRSNVITSWRRALDKERVVVSNVMNWIRERVV